MLNMLAASATFGFRVKPLFLYAAGFKFFIRMCTSNIEDYFVPPEAVRGCTKLDRTAFQKEFVLPCIKITRANRCTSFLERLSHARLRCPFIKPMINIPSVEDGKDPGKLLLLLPHHLMERPLTQEDRDWISANEGEEATHKVSLGYADFTKRVLLRAIIPLDLEVPGSYEQVGHIAHYNLNAEHLPYKEIIGQVTIDKQPNIRTVVNKTDQIHHTFRFFQMELMAGEEDFIAKVKENQCTFTLDFTKVYWNSRLETEHSAVVSLMNPGEVVLDMFAGVGPFAIPAAKNRRCIVHGNDLNPHSYTYLLHNAKANNVASRVTAYNLDGREFISLVTKDLVEKSLSSRAIAGTNAIVPYSHVIMNLPATAVEFLDVFRGLFGFVAEEHRSWLQLPLIHCYCFVEAGVEDKEVALKAVLTHLGVAEMEEGSYNVNEVRSVSRKKVIMRVSFKLSREVAYLDKDQPIIRSLQEEVGTEKTTGVDQGEAEGSSVVSEQAHEEADCKEPQSKRPKFHQTQ